MSTRLLLADDHELVREGLRSLIDEHDNLQVVAEASNGQETVALAASSGAHVVVMDVAMPDLNGIEATRQILRDQPHTKIVALSGHKDKHFVTEMLRAGASAYVLKQHAYDELVRAIEQVLLGNKYLSPDVARGVVDDYIELAPHQADKAAFVVLTDREREVLQRLAEGMTTKEMADALGVSVKTIETHRRNIMEKLNLHSVAELTKYAIREGVTSVDV